MFSQISNDQSFKSVHIREEDTKTQRNINEIFQTNLMKKIYETEIKHLNKITGNKDIFLSTTFVKRDYETGEKFYELELSDKYYNHIINDVYVSSKDTISVMMCALSRLNQKLRDVIDDIK